jgi:hypothetical protein
MFKALWVNNPFLDIGNTYRNTATTRKSLRISS